MSTGKALSDLLSKYTPGEVPVKSSLVGLVVYGAKEFFTRVTFNCPEDGYETYGSLFLYSPAVILFCLCLLASDSFWAATTSCFLRLVGRKLRLTWWKAKNAIYIATLLPLAWLVIAFVDTKFYVCAALGPENARIAKAANTTAAKAAVKRAYQVAASESQNIAWYILLTLMLMATLVMTVIRLQKKLDPKIISKEDVDKDEADMVVKLFHERVKPLLEEKAEHIVDNLLPKTREDVKEEEDIGVVIKEGIDILAKMYPSHGGMINGPYKDTDGAKGGEKVKSKGNKEHRSGVDETEIEVLVKE